MSRMPDHFSAVTAVHDVLWVEWKRLAEEGCPSCAAEEARKLIEPVLAEEIRKARAAALRDAAESADFEVGYSLQRWLKDRAKREEKAS